MRLALLIGFFAAAPAMAQPGYVAMGSSYAAGPNIGKNADASPDRCGRSAVNYAHLVAAARHYDLTDVTCSGATTRHILGPWATLPAQIDAVRRDTALVTITIGGNDLGYMAAIGVLRCARDGGAAKICPGMPAITADAMAGLHARMAAIVQQIHDRAPAARILIVPYFALMPAAGTCPAAGLPAAEVAQVRAIGLALARLTRQVAREGGAEVVPLDHVSAPHALCSAHPWMNGASPDMAAHDGVPYHPTAAGMAGAALAIERQIDRR